MAAEPADLPTQHDEQAGVVEYLDREAILLLIRTTFNVISSEDAQQKLALDATSFARTVPTDVEVAHLDAELEAEASYYFVSLEYLIEAGGAAWPSDRPASEYAGDALRELDGLQQEFNADLDDQEDPLPPLTYAQQIMALTNGQVSVPPANDYFGRRDQLVKAALMAAGFRAAGV